MSELDWSDVEAMAAPDVWEDPIPLQGPPPPRSLPIDALPDWVREMVRAVAIDTQTDPTMGATFVLSVLAACVAGRVEIAPKPGWREVLGLYTVVVAGPGERKTPVYNALVKPLEDAEERLVSSIAPLVAERAALKEIANSAAERAKNDAAKAKAHERDELNSTAVSAAQDAAAIVELEEPTLITDDASPEALTGLLAANGGRVAILSDEGGLFDILAGRFSGVPNLDPYLKGHIGSSLRVHRRSRGAEIIRRAVVTVGVFTQPQVLCNLSNNRELIGRGVGARFLYSIPASYRGYRNSDSPPVPEAIANTYNERVAKLALHFATTTAKEPAVLTLSPEADAIRTEWADGVERRFRPGGDLHDIPGWSDKLVGTTLRIAGILHMATHLTEGTDRQISLDTLRAAITLGETLVLHYRAALDLVATDAEDSTTQQILSGLIQKHMTTFTRRDVVRTWRSKVKNTAGAIEVLTVLTDLGWVRPVGTKGTAFELHPRAREHRESGDTVTKAVEAAFYAGQDSQDLVTASGDSPVTVVTEVPA